MTLEALRSRYQTAVNDAAAARSLWEALQDTAESAIEIAYRASARALMARHAFNPFDKLAFLKEANRDFRRAVRLDAENLEIRFLRFAIQHYIPAFVGESENLEEDKTKLLANFARFREFDLSPEQARQFWEFFGQTGRFSAVELSKMEAVLVEARA